MDNVVSPEDVAPVGAEILAVNVRPVGIFDDNAAVILLEELFVVTLHAVELSITADGLVPAITVVILRAPGLPETEIASTEEIV